MATSLKNKTVLLTGAGGGIGRAAAEKLAANGLNIILFGGNNLKNLNRTREIVSKYTDCLMLPGDLTDPKFLADGVRAAADRFGGIDILINNAGMTVNAGFEETSTEQFDRIMAINVRAPFLLTQRVIPFLRRSDCASIINIVSVVGHAGYPQQSVYTASKHALLGLTKSIAREYYREGIRVHAICPGGVFTDMVKISRPDLTPEGMIMPEEIADILWFLLANRGNAVIDEILVHRVNKEPFLV